MKILCLTPIKHLDGIYEYLESFGKVSYAPELDKKYFEGLTDKECKVLPSLMIEDSIKDIPDNSKVMGYPAKNLKNFIRENK